MSPKQDSSEPPIVEPTSKAPSRQQRLRRWLTVAVGAAAVLLGLFQFIRLPDAASRIDAFPLRGAAFASRDLAVEPGEQAIMGEARLVKRVCQTASQRVILSIIDGSRNRHAVHDPAYCLRGGGWTITAREPLGVPGGQAVKLSLARSGQQTEALFWFTDGGSRHASPTKQWLHSAMRRLTFGKSGPAPLLVLVFPADGVTPDWTRLWKEIPELEQL